MHRAVSVDVINSCNVNVFAITHTRSHTSVEETKSSPKCAMHPPSRSWEWSDTALIFFGNNKNEKGKSFCFDAKRHRYAFSCHKQQVRNSWYFSPSSIPLQPEPFPYAKTTLLSRGSTFLTPSPVLRPKSRCLALRSVVLSVRSL